MCTKCDGTGLITCVDWVDYGSTTVPMQTTSLCDCLDFGKCPVCDETLTEENVCPGCGRDWTDVIEG